MVGTDIQTISKGNRNLTRNTEVMMPINRNLLRHSTLIVLSTLAFTTALSTLLTTSKTTKPSTMAIDSTSDTAEARPNLWCLRIKLFSENSPCLRYKEAEIQQIKKIFLFFK
jgi:hypothetical protein